MNSNRKFQKEKDPIQKIGEESDEAYDADDDVRVDEEENYSRSLRDCPGNLLKNNNKLMHMRHESHGKV